MGDRTDPRDLWARMQEIESRVRTLELTPQGGVVAGTISHIELIDVTANQHHEELHAASHAQDGSDPVEVTVGFATSIKWGLDG